jgi:site-specific recombinase XerD
MRPQETKTTTQSIALFQQTLQGKNDTPESLRAYLSDLEQCVEWLKQRRVDWHIPYRIERLDIAAFINHLAERTQNQSIKRGPGASADGDDV